MNDNDNLDNQSIVSLSLVMIEKETILRYSLIELEMNIASIKRFVNDNYTLLLKRRPYIDEENGKALMNCFKLFNRLSTEEKLLIISGEWRNNIYHRTVMYLLFIALFFGANIPQSLTKQHPYLILNRRIDTEIVEYICNISHSDEEMREICRAFSDVAKAPGFNMNEDDMPPLEGLNDNLNNNVLISSDKNMLMYEKLVPKCLNLRRIIRNQMERSLKESW